MPDNDNVAPVARHDYVPSAMHMGDCAVCGHVQEAAIHQPEDKGWSPEDFWAFKRFADEYKSRHPLAFAFAVEIDKLTDDGDMPKMKHTLHHGYVPLDPTRRLRMGMML